MTVRVFPVEILPAEPAIDLHVVVPAGNAPVRNARALDASVDRVELALGHAEAHVMTLDLFPPSEVERQALVGVHGAEGSLGFGPRNAEEPGQEPGPADRIARRHDDVVELDGHGAPPERW